MSARASLLSELELSVRLPSLFVVVFFSYSFSFSRGSVFDKIEEEEEEEEEDGEEDADGESFKTDIEVDDRTYSVGNESSLNEGLRSRVRNLLSQTFASRSCSSVTHVMLPI